MVLLSRIIAALAYAGAAFLFGIAIGERGELGVVQYIFLLVIPVATFVLVLFSRQARAEVALTGLAMLAGVWLGQLAFARAFEACRTRAPILRAAIIEHHARTGDYPARLQDLKTGLPCDCILRKTILHYFGGDRGFVLWMTNGAKRYDYGLRRPTAT